MNEILTVTDKKIIGIGFYPAYILHLSNFGDIKVSEKLYSKIWIGGTIRIIDIDEDGEVEFEIINKNKQLNNDIMDRINTTITDIALHNNMIIEETIKNLLMKGCSCGNKNIKQFVVIYQENEFVCIKCEACGNHIYPIKKLITTEQIKG